MVGEVERLPKGPLQFPLLLQMKLSTMIRKLDNSNSKIAHGIFQVFQRSYKVEAALIGVTDFPPLLRTARDIEQAQTQFYGFYEGICKGDGAATSEALYASSSEKICDGSEQSGQKGRELAAVVEMMYQQHVLKINSLTVSPDHFRKGIAGKLLAFLLDKFDFNQALVETAVVNIPAIELYKKYGFVEVKQYTPAHGIPKVVMKIERLNT